MSKQLKKYSRFLTAFLLTLLILTCINCKKNSGGISKVDDMSVYPSIDDYPAWSPDGNKIIYYHYGISKMYPWGTFIIDPDSVGLWMVNADGTNPHIILNTRDVYADWSPDGNWIVFEHYGHIYKTDVIGDSINIPGIQQLTFEGSNYFPSWSPDGKKIVYDSDAAGGVHDLWIMGSDGLNKKQVTNLNQTTGGRMPDWSPDGKNILYMRYTPLFGTELALIDTSGKELIILTDDRYDYWHPRFSPDGTEICVHIAIEDGPKGLYIIDIFENKRHFLIERSGKPDWSPDGKDIVFPGWFNKRINEVGTLWIMGADGTGLRQLTHGHAEIMEGF